MGKVLTKVLHTLLRILGLAIEIASTRRREEVYIVDTGYSYNNYLPPQAVYGIYLAKGYTLQIAYQGR